MTTVKNFSRHPFNADQNAAIVAAGYIPAEGCEKPFFSSLADLINKIGGKISSAVIPGDLLRDAWSECLSPDQCFPSGTILIGWMTDQDARRRGRFAVRGIVIHEFRVVGCSLDSGSFEGIMETVVPVEIYRSEVIPTVENDFNTGEEFPYAGKFVPPQPVDKLAEAIELIREYEDYKNPPFSPGTVGWALGVHCSDKRYWFGDIADPITRLSPDRLIAIAEYIRAAKAAHDLAEAL